MTLPAERDERNFLGGGEFECFHTYIESTEGGDFVGYTRTSSFSRNKLLSNQVTANLHIVSTLQANELQASELLLKNHYLYASQEFPLIL
jgi:hypothetical protein